ncbi:MAG: [protein-PII] uridylyltransferase [Desulfobulbaceae bacterium]|nr:[protein-PII] uridylyltransferase [Desulfobulbaceae bacterium]
MPAILHSQREALENLWNRGISGHELLKLLTRMADEFIISHFSSSAAVHSAGGKIALIALGGYGRRELYPFSDIDLLLLHDRRAAKSMQQVAESILYPLWDSGYEVGHSVRTTSNAVDFARQDFIFLVSLLDARLLAGSEELFNKLRQRLQSKVLEGGRREFVEVMEAFREIRREKFGSHSYLLEPHIKEGKGGLRDIQSMLWVGNAVFGLYGIEAMEDAGLLEKTEMQEFVKSWNMLARIRNRLHYISGRKNDQLFFEYQEEMTGAFGYKDSSGVLAVEHFMREVYSHLQTVAVVTDLFFEHVREVLGFEGMSRREKQLDKDIVARNGSVRLAVRAHELQAKPHLMMRLFLQSGKTSLPLHHRTRQAVGNNLHLIDNKFRSSRKNARMFIEILLESRYPMQVFETMLESGLLTTYIPEFAGIESLAQHDLYHIYTVDRHQLQTVAELAELRTLESNLFQGLQSPHLLYLAALLHDIGKGRRKDHSELGAEIVKTIGERLGLAAEEIECLAFLVQYHLFLPENALRRDLEDLEFIRQCADLIEDIDRLTMLYLLTVADSKATGPSAWSSWKASLILELFLRIKSCLEAGCTLEHFPVVSEAEEEKGVLWLKSQILGLVRNTPVRMNVDHLPDDYLMSFTPEIVAHHLRLHYDEAARLRQRALVFPEIRQGYWSLLVMTRNRHGLLAKLCGVLALHNLGVLGAHIFTWPDETVVDVLNVIPLSNVDFSEHDWQSLEEDLNQAINYRLDVGGQLYQKTASPGFRQKRRVQQLKLEVVIDNEASRRFTIIEVYAADRLGTLYNLAQTLADFGLEIHRARIATEVEQLIDIFYVSFENGKKLEDPAQIDKVREALEHIIHNEDIVAA